MEFKLMIVCLLMLTSIVTSKKTNIPKRHAIKTIMVKGGDIVDCVDIYKQPAFDHPNLKNHIIQMKSSHLDPTKETPRTMQNSSSSKVPSQVWLQYGRCPKGTIPIHRSSNQTDVHPSKIVITKDHSFSVVITEGLSYSGAQGNIKVWNPFVVSIGDYSSSQVMLRTGPLKAFEVAQAGWAVNPIVYNDAKTRLFAYWSVDGMTNTGCFDLTCPGFVQTSSEVLLGGEITGVGSEITIHISKDRNTNNWWLRYNDNEVGYWPGDIFQLMKYQATSVQWGGEVYSPKVGTHPHTQTAMGNGEFSNHLSRRCGTITWMLIESNSNPPMRPDPDTLYISSDEWSCYDAYLLTRLVPEPVFFYGGPGARDNPYCS